MPNGGAVLDLLRARPLPRQRDFNRRPLPYMSGLDLPDVRFAFGAAMRQTVAPIVFGGLPLVSLEPPEASDGPALLSVTLGARRGGLVTLVRRNEWLMAPGWRFAHRTGKYLFTHDSDEAWLTLGFPGDGEVVIERARSRSGFHLLDIDRTGARLDGEVIDIPRSDHRMVGVRLAE